MSTRAMVGYVSPDGTWQAVWNHNDGQSQQLGRWILRQIKKASGELDVFRDKYIEGCEGGWSSMAKDKRTDDPVGYLQGTFDGIIATCDATANPLCFDSNYLYLLYPPKRRLYAFEVKEGPMRPFGIITFDEAGNAKPKKLPTLED